jgi:haloalkane dehalogenase
LTQVVRTPDERFSALPDFPWSPVYHEWDGIRLARVEAGEGPDVVFFHGEPTWSFLWRHVLPPVLEAGHRCIAPDLPGFGRSDKPTDLGWYSYDRHCDAAASFLEAADVRDATIVVHDWGSAVGLRVAVEHPDRISRLVMLDGGLFTGHQRVTEAWSAFRDFVERTEDLPIAMLVNGGTLRDLEPAEIAAYDAPFPDAASKAGARAFPLLIPLAPDAPGAAAGREALAALTTDTRPSLMLWADQDPIIPLATGKRFAQAINRPEPEVIAGASHFLQEDQGAEIGRRIADWLTEQGAV